MMLEKREHACQCDPENPCLVPQCLALLMNVFDQYMNEN